MSGCCKGWVDCWVFLPFCCAAVFDAMNPQSLQLQFTTVLCKLNQTGFTCQQCKTIEVLGLWVFFFCLAYIYFYTFMYPTCHLIQYFILSYAECSPVYPFPTKESFQPSGFLLIHTQAMKPFCSLNFPWLVTVSFQDKSRSQKNKQTAYKTLKSFPSLTSVSKKTLNCCSDSDTCRLKSDCCKNSCSFSWKFLPLLARTATQYNLGYYEKN